MRSSNWLCICLPLAYRYLIVVALSLLVIACKQSPSVTLPPLCITNQTVIPTEFYRSQCNKQSYKLTIEDYSQEENLMTVSATTNMRQYLLQASIHYSLHTPNGTPLAVSQSLSVDKPYVSDSNKILSAEVEKHVLIHEMKYALFRQLIASSYARINYSHK